MKETLLKIVKSRTIWAITAGAVVAILQAYQGYFSPELFAAIMGVLTILMGYFKLNPSADYGYKSN